MHRPDDPARIGPNAIIQLRDVLADRLGPAAGRSLFEAAGEVRWWDKPPVAMVAESRVRAVHLTVVARLEAGLATPILAEAGTRTGVYLLVNRIPAPVRWLFPHLPARLAARLLIRAVARHAWTFCGSGEFHYGFRQGLALAVRRNPLAVVTGDPWHRAVFETLFRALVSPACIVRSTALPPQGTADSGFLVLGPGFGL